MSLQTLSASEIYASVPELENYASIEPEVLLNEYSENLKPADWTIIAHKIKEKVASGEVSRDNSFPWNRHYALYCSRA